MLFSPGQCQITSAAAEFLLSRQARPEGVLARHLNGDWGTLGHHSEILPTLTPEERQRGQMVASEDSQRNCISVLKGSGLVMSIYPFGDEVVWILSELCSVDSTTTILLPHEY